MQPNIKSAKYAYLPAEQTEQSDIRWRLNELENVDKGQRVGKLEFATQYAPEYMNTTNTTDELYIDNVSKKSPLPWGHAVGETTPGPAQK